MDENEHIYTTLRMPVDPEREKHRVYIESYSPQIDKSDWKRINYQVDWFKKGILFWYMQKFKHKLFKNALCPREMTIWVDICIKDNIDEVKRLLDGMKY